MSNPRKTLNVTELVSELNRRIQFTGSVDGRLALCFTVERILHDSNRYRGFRFTNMVEVPEPNGEISLVSPDESFRHYFCPEV